MIIFKQIDKVSLISIAADVKVIFSLCEKSKNTIQLRNQIEFLQSYDEGNVNLLGGLVESIDELYTESQGKDENESSWISCIWGSQDFSSFSDEAQYIKLWNYIKESQINIVFILIGELNKKDIETSL